MIGELCRALVRSGRGKVTEERCLEFLRGFQSVTALRRAELYLFPAALRAALIHSVAAVCRAMEFADGSDEYAPTLEALFGALRLFAVLDLENLLDSADMTAEALRADPDGVFQRMDSASRGEYLRRIEYLSHREGVEEHIYARRLVKKARAEGRHAGFYLFPEPKPSRGRGYIAANLLLTLFISLWLAFRVGSAAAAMVNICAFVIFFLVVMALVRQAWPTVPPLALGLLELTGGVTSLEASPAGFCMAAALLGWGGVSVHCQTAAVLEDTGLSLKRYLLAKALQAVVSALFALGLCCFSL